MDQRAYPWPWLQKLLAAEARGEVYQPADGEDGLPREEDLPPCKPCPVPCPYWGCCPSEEPVGPIPLPFQGWCPPEEDWEDDLPPPVPCPVPCPFQGCCPPEEDWEDYLPPVPCPVPCPFQGKRSYAKCPACNPPQDIDRTWVPTATIRVKRPAQWCLPAPARVRLTPWYASASASSSSASRRVIEGMASASSSSANPPGIFEAIDASGNPKGNFKNNKDKGKGKGKDPKGKGKGKR